MTLLASGWSTLKNKNKVRHLPVVHHLTPNSETDIVGFSAVLIDTSDRDLEVLGILYIVTEEVRLQTREKTNKWA